MKASVLRAMSWAGSLAGFLGLVFVAMRLKDYLRSDILSHIPFWSWISCLALTILYAIANILLALAWRHLLLQYHVKTTRLWSIKTYGISQLAKYIPGNVFQFAGRQGIGMSAGISGGVLAKSSLFELGLIAIAASLYGWLVLPIFRENISTAYSAVLFILSFLAIGCLFRFFFGLHIAVCFCQHVVFLLISGIVFAILLAIILNSSEYPAQIWLMIIGSYIIALLAGLIMPGSPAGVGVREWMLFFLLKNYISEIDLILVIFLGRGITVIGDSLFFCAATLIPMAKKNGEKNYD
jgi:MFS family permease